MYINLDTHRSPPSYRVANDSHWWVANFQPLLVLSSPRPRQAYAATLAVPSSLNRLAALRLQCASWPGVLAVAVYAPFVNGTLYSPGKPPHGWSTLALTAWVARVYNSTQSQGL